MPYTRILGHWKLETSAPCSNYCYPDLEYYFTPIMDEKTLIGNIVIITSEGNTHPVKWQVYSQDKAGKSIMVDIIYPFTGDIDPLGLNVAKDGKSMTNEEGDVYIYVDNKTKP